MRLKITGLDELRDAIAVYGERLVSEGAAAVEEAVRGTIADARNAAPVGNYPANWKRKPGGYLKSRIGGEVKADRYGVIGRAWVRAYYAGVLEFGSKRIKARPFFIPYAVARRRAMNARIRRAVVDAAPRELAPSVTGEAGA